MIFGFIVPGLSFGVVGVILNLAVLTEHRLVTDRQTYIQTDTGTHLCALSVRLQKEVQQPKAVDAR